MFQRSIDKLVNEEYSKETVAKYKQEEIEEKNEIFKTYKEDFLTFNEKGSIYWLILRFKNF